jgi:hypothetical protein
VAGKFKIVSGGQTGADRAALDFALAHGIPRGGWSPKGRLAEDDPLAPCYQLDQTPRSAYLPDKQEKATQTVLQQAELLYANWAD